MRTLINMYMIVVHISCLLKKNKENEKQNNKYLNFKKWCTVCTSVTWRAEAKHTWLFTWYCSTIATLCINEIAEEHQMNKTPPSLFVFLQKLPGDQRDIFTPDGHVPPRCVLPRPAGRTTPASTLSPSAKFYQSPSMLD